MCVCAGGRGGEGGGVSRNDFIFIHDFTNLNYPSTHVYIAEIHVTNSKRYSRGGGGHSGLNMYPLPNGREEQKR